MTMADREEGNVVTPDTEATMAVADREEGNVVIE